MVSIFNGKLLLNLDGALVVPEGLDDGEVQSLLSKEVYHNVMEEAQEGYSTTAFCSK